MEHMVIKSKYHYCVTYYDSCHNMLCRE